MYEELKKINRRPLPYEFYTAEVLWADEHTSAEMLKYHLNKDVDMASRNKAFIGKSTLPSGKANLMEKVPSGFKLIFLPDTVTSASGRVAP